MMLWQAGKTVIFLQGETMGNSTLDKRIVVLVTPEMKTEYTAQCERNGQVPSERIRELIAKDIERLGKMK